MAKIDKAIFDIGYLDTLSAMDTVIHRIDPRAKVITTLVFIITVVSFSQNDIVCLVPFFIYPVIMLAIIGIPFSYVLKKLLIIAPFVFFIGIFNPVIDRKIILYIGDIGVSSGWISFLSLIIRFILTALAAIILIASTGFNNVCMALGKIGAPKIFTIQLLLLYRYIFVLLQETAKTIRARDLRSFNGRGAGIKNFISILSHLLTKTILRSQRIYLAMQCRGFNGEIIMISNLKFDAKSIFFLIGWMSLFLFMRKYNIPIMIVKLIQ